MHRFGRFSLRVLLIAIAVIACALHFALPHRWRAEFHPGWRQNDTAQTREGVRYRARWMTKSDSLGDHRFLHCVIYPWGVAAPHGGGTGNPYVTADGDGLERLPGGVYFDGELVGGQGLDRVLICLGRNDVRVIPVTQEDFTALSNVRGDTLLTSKVWQSKIEPQIERIVGPSGNLDYVTWRYNRFFVSERIPVGSEHERHEHYKAWLQEKNQRAVRRQTVK